MIEYPSSIIRQSRQVLQQLMQSWLPIFMVTGVLLLSFVLPLKLSSRQLIFLMVLPVGIGGLLLLIRWPSLGPIILIFVSLLAPSPALPGGLNVAVLFLGLLIGLWLLNMLVKEHKIQLLPSQTIRPLLIFLVIATLSFLVGQLSWFDFARPAPIDAQLGGLAIFVLAVGAFLLVAHQTHDLGWLKWLTWVFLILGAFYMSGRLVPAIRPFTTQLFDLSIGRNSMFWTWLVALGFGQAIFNQDLHPKWRAALMALVAATLYVAYVKSFGWKSGYLPALVCIATIIGARSWRTGLFLALLSIGPAMFLGNEAIATDEYSYSTRLDAWIIMLEIIKANPIIGLGPANYYWYTPLFPIRGWAVVFNSHSQYVDIVAQTGLLGLACILWFAWVAGRLAWKLRDKVIDGFARGYIYGTLGGLVGTMASGILADWFLPFVYNIGLRGFRASVLPWLFFGGLVALEKVYETK